MVKTWHINHSRLIEKYGNYVLKFTILRTLFLASARISLNLSDVSFSWSSLFALLTTWNIRTVKTDLRNQKIISHEPD